MGIAKNCKTRKELSIKDCSVYAKMVKTGWIEECDWFIPNNQEGKVLSYEYCMEIARQYASIKDMRQEHPSVASRLYTTGWIKECTWLPVTKRKVSQFTMDGKYVATYDSIVEATRSLNLSSKNLGQSISQVCSGKRHFAYGYKWRYADEPIEQPKSETKPLVQGELALT